MSPKVTWLIYGRSRAGYQGSPGDSEFSSNTSLCQRPGELGQGSRWREKNSGLRILTSSTVYSAPIFLCDLKALAFSGPDGKDALIPKVFSCTVDIALGIGASRKSRMEQRCQELRV